MNTSRNRSLQVGSACLLICHFLILAQSPSGAATASSVTQRAVTWTFDAPETVGQYANGDWWVVGPVTITSIAPACVNDSGWIKHGAVVNPVAGNGPQGLDNSMDQGSQGPTYAAAANVDPGITGQDLTVVTGTVVKAISRTTTPSQRSGIGYRGQLQGMEYLTVVATAPAADSFRPPPVGTNKASSWTKGDLDYSILSNHPILAGAPTLTTAETWFEKPWPNFIRGNQGRWIHPLDNMPEYGRDSGRRQGDGGLVLHSNYSNQQKELLYIRLVQMGIDTYGTINEGIIFEGKGGINCGWKFPVVLAGLALDDAAIKAIAATQSFGFDLQTWYVEQRDVGRTLYSADGRPRVEYIQSDVGIPEWGEQHWKQEVRDGRNWNAYYRDIAMTGEFSSLLSTLFTTGGRAAWNWEASFDYMDRAYLDYYKAITNTDTNHLSNWEKAVYDTYRNGSNPGTGGGPDVTPPTVSLGNPTDGSTVTGNVLLSATASDNIAVTGVRFYVDGILVYDDVTAPYSFAWNSTSATEGTHLIHAEARDLADNQSSSTQITVTVDRSTIIATSQWQNMPLASQSGQFELTFTATPNGTAIDGVLGMSESDAGSYSDLGPILRFYTNGRMEARNGGAYQADTDLNYAAGTPYDVIMQIDLLAHRYTVQVSPPNSPPVVIASDYQFRSEQSSVSSLDRLAFIAGSGNFSITDIQISSAANRPAAPLNFRIATP